MGLIAIWFGQQSGVFSRIEHAFFGMVEWKCKILKHLLHIFWLQTFASSRSFRLGPDPAVAERIGRTPRWCLWKNCNRLNPWVKSKTPKTNNTESRMINSCTSRLINWYLFKLLRSVLWTNYCPHRYAWQPILPFSHDHLIQSYCLLSWMKIAVQQSFWLFSPFDIWMTFWMTTQLLSCDLCQIYIVIFPQFGWNWCI